jgi:dTDP-4-amino-4,6-dideoxygalactose transaminase
MHQVAKALTDNDIQSKHYFSPSLETVFTDCKSYGTQNSLALADGILSLPLHASMTIMSETQLRHHLKGKYGRFFYFR